MLRRHTVVSPQQPCIKVPERYMDHWEMLVCLRVITTNKTLQFVDKYHNRVGSNVLKRWKFPFQTIHVALNHDRLESCSSFSKELLIVHFANILAKTRVAKDLPAQMGVAMEDIKSARLLGITPDTIAEIEDQIDESLALYGTMIDTTP